jgi:2-dehydropantoate 2-reductase
MRIALAFCAALAPDATPSMQRDLLEGRCSELESIVGVAGRLGAALGVPTPAFNFLYGALLPQEKRVWYHVI